MTQASPVSGPGGSEGAPKTSGMAIASLVCGIVGPCTAGVLSLVGIVLGIVGIMKVNRSGGRVKGTGLAVAGIVVSAAGLVVVLVAAAILVPTIMAGMTFAGAMKAQNDMQTLCQGMVMYAMENNGEFPEADGWEAALADGQFVAPGLLRDRTDPDAGPWYAMNRAVGGKSMDAIARPGETVLFFECARGCPGAGGREDLPEEPAFMAGYTIGFCDGHVRIVPQAEVEAEGLVWEVDGK